MSDGHLISTDGGLDMLSDEEAEYLMAKARTRPNLGESVYVICVEGKEIYKYEVYARGRDFFIPKGAYTLKPEYREIRFSEKGSRWFFDLEEAKDKLFEYLTDEEEIVQQSDELWSAERL